MYELYEQQQLTKIKFENYATATSSCPEFSKELMAKRYLGFSETEWKEHCEKAEAEQLRVAVINRKAKMIEDTGNPYQGTGGGDDGSDDDI